MPYANPATPVLREPAQSKMHMDMSQEAFVRKFTGKMPDANPAANMWCEPAQSKCIWTCHKRHFVQKFTGKMPDANPAASILCEPAQVEIHMDMSQEAFVQNLQGKCWTLILQQAFCASLRSRNAHGHVTRGICAENYKENAGR